MQKVFTKSSDFKRFQEFLCLLRDQGIHESIDLSRPCHIAFSREKLHYTGKPVQEIQIIFAAHGCVKALSHEAPCTMCGFINESNFGKPVSPALLIKQFDYAAKLKGFRESSIVTLLNSGSMFCEAEFPQKARENIFKKLNGYKNIEEVIIESRPEFVSEKAVEEVKKLLKDKKVELSFGLEAATDIVREQFVNKGFSKNNFERAINLARKHKLDTHCYVLIKPPFLTEKEAIDEAIKTVRYCFKIGVFGVTVMPCGVQENTLTEFLYKNKEYRPPWLWSVIEVIKKTRKIGYVRIGTSEESVVHLNDPHNCSCCDTKILKQFERYNLKHDFSVLNKLSCGCKKEWQKELKIKNKISLNKRLENFINKYNI